jgi:hypothetical protein
LNSNQQPGFSKEPTDSPRNKNETFAASSQNALCYRFLT